MKRFGFLRTAVVLVAAAFLTTGCASTIQTLKDDYNAVASAVSSTVSSEATPKAVAVAISSFDAIKITATNYTRLPRCNGTNGPICRDPALRVKIKQAVAAGTVARNNLKAFLRQNPKSLADAGLYNSLLAAKQTLTDATAAYRAAGGQ